MFEFCKIESALVSGINTEILPEGKPMCGYIIYTDAWGGGGGGVANYGRPSPINCLRVGNGQLGCHYIN